MHLLPRDMLFLLCKEVFGYFPPRFFYTLLSGFVTFEITGSFLFLSVPLNSLLPTSPGIHQATVRGGAETVRDLAAAATA